MTVPPSVSLVIPAYNSATTLGAAVSSALWQSYTRLEILVVDDGSTDGTADIANAYAAVDDRVRVLSQANGGVGSARNLGISHSTGDLLTFLDADDILLAEHVAALVQTWAHRADCIVTANSHYLFPAGLRTTGQTGRFAAPASQRLVLLQQNYLSIMSLFHRSLVDRIGGFDVDLLRCEDWEFWLRAVYQGCRVVQQPKPLSMTRWSNSSLSSDRALVYAAETQVLQRMWARTDLRSEERDYLRERLRGQPPRESATAGDTALRAGSFREAAARYAEAARLCPSEKMLVQKARLMRTAPMLVGPVLRRRQQRIEAATGIDSSYAR